jgi:exonuclease SbcC
MKILRISLRNIASLAGTHTVDFTSEPLRSAGLFSISGPTGAGKSSLLDALCLALYDDTPRLGAVGKLAKLDDGVMTQNDPRNLLRRGTAEGFAEVAFTGVDGADYTARWSVRRSRNKTDGQIQKSELALYRGNIPSGAGGVLEQGGKKTEVLPVIASKVGLTFEQFTRAVLLAQNDFAAFLKADDRERAEILQALTGTERFEAISVAVFERAKSEQEVVKIIEARLAGTPPLDAEMRLAAEAEWTAAAAAKESAQSALETCRQHRKWFEELVLLEKKLQEARSGHERAVKAREDAAPRRALLTQTEEAAHARPLFEAETKEKNAAIAAAGKCQEAGARREECQVMLQKAGEAKAAAETARDAARHAFDAARPGLQTARELDAKLGPLADRLEKAKSESSAAAVVCTKLGQEHRKLVPEFAMESLPGEPELLAALERARTALDLARAAAAQHDGGAIAEARRALEAARTALDRLRDQLKEYDFLTEQGQQAAKEIERLEGVNSEEAAAATALRAQHIPAAEHSLTAAREAHARAAAAVEDASVQLRETLRAGEPCPVCGATDHPFSSHPPTADAVALRALLKNCQEKEETVRKLQAQLAGLVASIRNRDGQIAGQRIIQASCADQLQALTAVPHEHADCRAVMALPEASRRAAAEEKLASLAAESERLESADLARRKAEQHVDACRREHEAAVSALRLAEARADLQKRQAEEREAAAAHREVMDKRAQLFAGRAANEVEHELQRAVAAGEENLHSSAGRLHEAEKACTAAAEAVKAAMDYRDDMQRRHHHAAAALDSWLADFSRRHAAPLDRAGLTALLERDAAWCAQEHSALEELDRHVQTLTGECRAHETSMKAHEAARPTPDDEPAVSAALDEWTMKLTDASERCDKARAVITADDQRRRDKEALAKELAVRRDKADPWQKLNELIGSADGAKFRSLAQRRTLDILLGYANAQLDHLSPRYRLERVPESLNLIVLDRDMADERRSVHSLSGGESFLVSLALALGLASLTSNRLRIESLFIDEGFGSLDAETLNTAMSALMQLEAQGRKVGVISHVAEMADAIPVQIRVVKGRGGVSHLEMPGADC